MTQIPKVTRLKIAQNNLCYYCERKFGKKKRKPTREHLHRICDGGDASGDNIVLACEYCNNAREDVNPEVWKIICMMIERNTKLRKKYYSRHKQRKFAYDLRTRFNINRTTSKKIARVCYRPIRRYFYYRRKVIELYGKVVYTSRTFKLGD